LEQSLLEEGINEDTIYLGRRVDHNSGQKQQGNRLCKSFEHKFTPQSQKLKSGEEDGEEAESHQVKIFSAEKSTPIQQENRHGKIDGRL
jgi:hypothetical protein